MKTIWFAMITPQSWRSRATSTTSKNGRTSNTIRSRNCKTQDKSINSNICSKPIIRNSRASCRGCKSTKKSTLKTTTELITKIPPPSSRASTGTNRPLRRNWRWNSLVWKESSSQPAGMKINSSARSTWYSPTSLTSSQKTSRIVWSKCVKTVNRATLGPLSKIGAAKSLWLALRKLYFMWKILRLT